MTVQWICFCLNGVFLLIQCGVLVARARHTRELGFGINCLTVTLICFLVVAATLYVKHQG